MNNRTRFAFFLLLLSGCLFASPPAGGVAPADDAYHYRYWADGSHDGNYTEWWYFNLFDDRRDLQAIFTYLVTDPENLTGRGMAQLTAVAYTAQEIVSANDIYPPDSFSASYVRADVRIETNAIQVIGPDLYRITGASRDGRLSWDLVYLRRLEPWPALNSTKVGTLPWEKMSWLVYMPRAVVTGQVSVDGQAYSVSAPGYHDHNWGEWIFTDALWNWAQYSQPDFAFDLGDFIGKPAGIASFDFQGRRVVFTKDQYTLVHTRWAFDPVNGVLYPVESLLAAENGAERLVLVMRAIRTEPIRGDLPFPLRDAIIYEQTASFQGRLWVKDSAGQWVPSLSFDGPGFKEYTAKHY